MPPVYEFACPRGHVIEDLVSIGTKTVPCTACQAERLVARHRKPMELATRILSATRTDFEFADSRRKRSFT